MDYYVVDASSSYQDGNIVTIAGVDYTVIQVDDGFLGGRTDAVVGAGDNVLVSGSMSGTLTIAPNDSTPENSPLTVSLEATTDTYTLRFSDPLFGGSFTPTVVVDDGVDASGANVVGTGTDGITVDVGASAELGQVTGSAADDIITTEAGSTVGGISTSDGNDSVTIGGTASSFNTGNGDDTVAVLDGASVTYGSYTGSGNDSVSLGDGATTAGINLSNSLGDDGNDLLTLGTDATVNGTILTGGGNDTITAASDTVTGVTITGDIVTGDADVIAGDVTTITLGDFTTIGGSITAAGSEEDSTFVTLGANSSVAGDISLDGGDDAVTLGENSTVTGGVDLLIGADTLTAGSGVTIGGGVQMGANDDVVNVLGSGSYTVDFGTVVPNDDFLNVSFHQDEAGFLTALADQGFTDADGDGVYYGGANSTFTYGGITYTNADWIQGVPCFVAGTRIKTRTGEIPVEDLTVGTEVLTLDNGYMRLRWIGSREMSVADLAMRPHLRPIRIQANALGENQPERDLLVSPQHRVLCRSRIVERMFEEGEVLASAKHLLALEGVDVAEDVAAVTYWHFMFDSHQVVFSNGAATESMYAGTEALKSVSPEAREEIMTLFPELRRNSAVKPQSARALIPGRLAHRLAERIARNKKELCHAV